MALPTWPGAIETGSPITRMTLDGANVPSAPGGHCGPELPRAPCRAATAAGVNAESGIECGLICEPGISALPAAKAPPVAAKKSAARETAVAGWPSERHMLVLPPSVGSLRVSAARPCDVFMEMFRLQRQAVGCRRVILDRTRRVQTGGRIAMLFQGERGDGR